MLPDEAQNLARLDADAIERVRSEALPDVRNADELLDLLDDLVVTRDEDLSFGDDLVLELVRAARAARIVGGDARRLFAVERVGLASALFPDAEVEPAVQLPTHLGVESVEAETALDAAVRGHLSLLGPTDSRQLAERIGVPAGAVEAALVRLEGAGVAVRGRFEPDAHG